MKSLLLLLIALTCLTVYSNPVHACTCAEYGVPACAAYWRADAVFVGQLREITPPDKISPGQMPTAMLHFIVEQPFRGITAATVDVETLFGTSCDMRFAKGTRYLIYAQRDSKSNQLFAGPCTRTEALQYADEDLNYIRSLMQQGATESVAGRIQRFAYQPLPALKIEVRNENQRFETTSDEKGDFSVALAGPGRYTVKMLIPASVEVYETLKGPIGNVETTDSLTIVEYKIELSKGQCDYRQLDVVPVNLHATAEVSGTVLTARGRPVNKGYVYLMKGNAFDRFNYTEIGKDGFFKFEAVSIGEYLLVLNPENKAPDEYDAPYPRSFYPNARDASGATKIVVTEGAKLENLTLRVGPPWREKVVSGRVVWQKDQPAPEANVSLYDGDRYVRMVRADDKGLFSFKVYGDFKYAIKAISWGKRPGKSDRLTLSDKSTDLTLVLKPE